MLGGSPASALSSNDVPVNAAVKVCRLANPSLRAGRRRRSNRRRTTGNSPSGRSATVRMRIAASKTGSQGVRLRCGAPILDARQIARGEIVAEIMRGRQPRNVGEYRARRRNCPMREIRVDAARRESSRSRGGSHGKQRAYGRCECEAVFAMRIHDRLYRRRRSRITNMTRAAKVADRDREHAAEARDEIDSPMLVGVENEFGVGAGAEVKPRVPQHGGVRAQS